MTNVFRLGQSPGAVVFMAMHDSGKKNDSCYSPSHMRATVTTGG